MALPLPSYEPGGAFVNALNRMNALQKSGAEAKYAPYTEYANAMSKLAFAQMAGPNALAQFMSGPGAAQLSKEQIVALGNQMQNYMKNYNPNTIVPAPNAGGGLANQLIQGLMNKLLPQSMQSNNALQQPMPTPSGGSAFAPNQDFGINNQATPQEVQNIAENGNNAPPLPNASTVGTGVKNLPFNRQAANMAVPGSVGGETPTTGAEATKAATVAGATGEAESANNMWKVMHENDAKSAIATQTTNDLADEFSDAYDRASNWEKGPIKGLVPALFSEAADTADRAALGMADAVARASQEGHITVTDRQTYGSMKFSRNMRPETKENSIAFIKGMNQRIQEHAIFNVAAQKQGLTPPEANAVWINYIKNNPFYNSKEHKLNENNFNKWPQYLTPEKISQALQPTPNQNINKKPNNQKMFQIYSPQGKLVATGSRDAAAKFLKDHRGYYQKAIQ